MGTMSIQFEWIMGFLLGIDYVEDINVYNDQYADLIRFSFGLFWINVFILK